MHRELRSLLDNAQGESDLVVVIFLDVRGFSSFAGMAESSEAALFLRRIYIRILDEYFPNAAFFKPTGDGLMVIQHIDSDSLDDRVADSIEQSLRLVTEFPQISDQDPMVNFDVPVDLGIGIARGAATRLESGDRTLDYSGRPLNLAARLMDLARPRGVVVDGRVLKGLALPEHLSSQLTIEEVFVKGIADASPITVHHSRDVTVRYANRRPLVGEPYEQVLGTLTFKRFSSLGRFLHELDREPVDPDAVTLEVGIPVVDSNGRRDPETVTFKRLFPVRVNRIPTGWEIGFDYKPAIVTCAERGVKSTWPILRRLRYSILPDGAGAPEVETTQQ